MTRPLAQPPSPPRRDRSIDDGFRELSEFVRHRFDHSCQGIADAIVDEFGASAQDDQAVMVLRPLHQRAPGLGRLQPIEAVVSTGR